MSTPPATQLSPASTPTTSAAVVVPATRPAESPAELMPVFVGCALIVAIGAELARRLKWFGRDWSPERCRLPQEAGLVGFGLGSILAVGYFVVPAILIVLGFPVGQNADPSSPRRDVLQTIAFTLIYLGGLASVPLAALVLGQWPQQLGRIGLAPPLAPNREVRVWLLAAPILIALTTGVMIVAQMIWYAIGYQHASAHPMLQLMDRSRSHPLLVALTAFNAVVLAPVFEEVLFRGHLQTVLVRLFGNRWAGIAIAAGLFAALHEKWTIPPIFALAVFIGYVFERTGSLWLAIALHASFNAFNTLLLLAGGT